MNIMEETFETKLIHKHNEMDWIEQCFTSPPTQYRLYARRFLQVKRPNQQYQSTKGKTLQRKNQNNVTNKIHIYIDNNRQIRIHHNSLQ